MLKIKSIRNITLISTVALTSLIACVPSQPKLRQTTKPYLSKRSLELLDSFTKEITLSQKFRGKG